MRGEDVSFSEKGVQEVMRKNIGRLNNVLAFYALYKNEVSHTATNAGAHVLDGWIVARLNETLALITKGMEQYELDRATRPIADFIDDFSTWYVRRSRDRFKGSDEQDKEAALGTTKYVLIESAKMIAPFMPFYAEYLYKELSSEKESVHLESWNEGGNVDEASIEEMRTLRAAITLGLEARDVAQIKVRQPLKSASFPKDKALEREEYVQIMKDELNVKEVMFEKRDDVKLDLKMTDELIAEGHFRDLLRHVQSLRKKASLEPKDVVTMYVVTDDGGKKLIEKYEEELSETAGLGKIIFESKEEAEPVSIGDSAFNILLVK
jgi:isoleucyl-tRNA synthetase